MVDSVVDYASASHILAYAAYSADKWRDEVKKNKKAEFVIPLVNQIDGNDPQGRQKSMKLVRQWNEQMKAEGKPYMMISFEEEARMAKQRRRQNSKTPKQVEKGNRQAEAWGF